MFRPANDLCQRPAGAAMQEAKETGDCNSASSAFRSGRFHASHPARTDQRHFGDGISGADLRTRHRAAEMATGAELTSSARGASGSCRGTIVAAPSARTSASSFSRSMLRLLSRPMSSRSMAVISSNACMWSAELFSHVRNSRSVAPDGSNSRRSSQAAACSLSRRRRSASVVVELDDSITCVPVAVL